MDVFEDFDAERRRLARELHGTAAQQLAALQIDLSLIAESAAGLSPRAERALAESVELAQQCGRQIRAIEAQLHPLILEEFGLLAALRALGLANVTVESNFDEEARFPARIEMGAYRIVEALIGANAPDSMVSVVLHRSPGFLSIVVSHPACLVPESVNERANRLGAEFSLIETGGFQKRRIALPLTSAES